MLQKLILLGAAGAMGTLARYACSSLSYRLLGTVFPWGTLFVNVTGCFLFGVIVGLTKQSDHVEGDLRFFALTGFLGAFTTFSTFAFETTDRLRAAEWSTGFANFAAQNALGLTAAWCGLLLGEFAVRRAT